MGAGGIRNGKLRRAGRRALPILFGAFLLVSAASFFANDIPVLDLFVHFRPQLAAAAVVFVVAGLAVRRRVVVGLAALAALAHVAPMLPYLLPQASATACGDPSRPLRFATINLHLAHVDIDRLAAWLAKERPDVLALTEVPPEPSALFRALGDALPNRFGPTGHTPTDLMILSRFPIATTDVYYTAADRTDYPVVEARICPPGRPCLTVVALHPPPPMGAGRGQHDAQIRLAARVASKSGDARLVLLGDLNLTPWPPLFRELLDEASLSDSALRGPFRATWMSRSPLFGLVIDHILVGREVAVQHSDVGPDIGSDHYPVTAHLSMCSQPSA